MDFSQQLALSYYKTIATLNEAHNIFLVQHQQTNKIYVKKIIDVYNIDIYKELTAHPICGVPSIIEFYEIEGQLIVIENYISGTSLEDILLNVNTLSLSEVCNYIIELCVILDNLHNLPTPIIHRDIKPSNIIITEHKHVVLIDFNAAKYFSEGSESDTVLLGTKGYAAPEQFGFGSSSPQTDIYALGILMKELSSKIDSIPEKLHFIIEKCTKMNPSERYSNVSELANAIKELIAPSQSHTKDEFSYNQLLPPGFRTRTAWKMFLAIPIYLFTFWLSLSLEVENTTGISLWIQRIFCLTMFLSIISGTFNYMGMQDHFPLCKSKYRVIRFIGIILLDITLVATLFITMMIILSIFSL